MTDYIKRADAIEVMCCDCEGEHYPKCDRKKYCKEVKTLLALPSADAVEVDRTSEWVAVRREEYENLIADAVHGEWKFVDHEIFAGEYFCNICGKRANVDLYGEWILSNYCPSCGARMKGGAK